MHLFELGEDLAGVAQQGFAGTGEFDAAGAADEECRAECAFQLPQPVAGRRRASLG